MPSAAGWPSYFYSALRRLLGPPISTLPWVACKGYAAGFELCIHNKKKNNNNNNSHQLLTCAGAAGKRAIEENLVTKDEADIIHVQREHIIERKRFNSGMRSQLNTTICQETRNQH